MRRIVDALQVLARGLGRLVHGELGGEPGRFERGEDRLQAQRRFRMPRAHLVAASSPGA
jgi:hypothetical protein